MRLCNLMQLDDIVVIDMCRINFFEQPLHAMRSDAKNKIAHRGRRSNSGDDGAH